HRVNSVTDELHEGDQILVKVLAIEGNRIKLSRKAILREQRAKMAAENGGGGEGGEAVTIEGGADFDESEPNLNRAEAAHAGAGQQGGGGGHHRGDRGGDRGGRGGRGGGGGRGGRGGRGGGRGGDRGGRGRR